MKTFKRGSVLYKRVFKKEFGYVSNMRALEWFALTEDYGSDEAYGPIKEKYKVKRDLKLLDIGNGLMREKIEDVLVKADPSSHIVKYSNPDEQYSGGNSNEIYHKLLKSYFTSFDGTIIDDKNLKPGKKYSVSDLDGPSEVVLWGNLELMIDRVK